MSIGETHAHLTTPQLRKLHKGETVQLKHEHIGEGLKIHLAHGKIKKMLTAKRNKKGMRLKMTPEEVEMNGHGIFDFIKKVAHKVGSFVKNDVAPVAKSAYKGYQKYVKPVVGPAIRKGLAKALPVAVAAAATMLGQPELAIPAAAFASKIATPLVDTVGNVSGAYGLKHKKRFHLREDSATMVHSRHPAMNPVLPLPDFSKPDHKHSGGRLTRGGSFLASGGY